MKTPQRQGTPARCQQIREQLSVGETRPRALLRALFHLVRCSECRAFHRAVRSQRADVETLMDVTPSRDLKARTLDQVAEEANGEG
jgi:predicted anti-sigma-YlaC factor YlaD